MSDDTCGEVYAGPSYPEFHGEKCVLPKGHVKDVWNARHKSRDLDYGPIGWYDAQQKAARRARKVK
jgi:hypothetical protein